MFYYDQNPLFPNVVALSPSVYWADLYILKLLMQKSAKDMMYTINLYIGIGEQEDVENNILFNENMLFVIQE